MAQARRARPASLAGSMRILACVSGSAECAERRLHPVEPDHAGDHARGVHLALGEHLQGVAELERRVADDEAQVDLLVDRHRRPYPVGAHADTDHDDPGEQRGPGDDLVDHAGSADALEDHRASWALLPAPPPPARPATRAAAGVAASRPFPPRGRPPRGPSRGARDRCSPRTASPWRGRRRRRRRRRRPAPAGPGRNRSRRCSARPAPSAGRSPRARPARSRSRPQPSAS